MLLGGGTNTTDDADQDISFMNFAGGYFGTTGFMLDGAWDTDTEWGGVIFVPSVDAVRSSRSRTTPSLHSTDGARAMLSMWSPNPERTSSTAMRLGLLSEPGLSTPSLLLHLQPEASRVRRAAFGRRATLSSGASTGNRKRPSSLGCYEHLPSPVRQSIPIRFPTATSATATFLRFWVPRRSAPTVSGGPSTLGRSTIRAAATLSPRASRIRSRQPIPMEPGSWRHKAATSAIPSPATSSPIWPAISRTRSAQSCSAITPTPRQQGLSNNLIVSGTAPAHSNEYTLRVDHNINDKSRAYFRYCLQGGIQDRRGGRLGQ